MIFLSQEKMTISQEAGVRISQPLDFEVPRFQNCEMFLTVCLLFKPPSLWYFCYNILN